MNNKWVNSRGGKSALQVDQLKTNTEKPPKQKTWKPSKALHIWEKPSETMG